MPDQTHSSATSASSRKDDPQFASSSWKPFEIGGALSELFLFPEQDKLTVICGPCVIESRDAILQHAKKIVEQAQRAGVRLIFKSSYDKANRTSKTSFRGVGIEEGLEILSEVRREFGVPVISDVHSPEDAQKAGEVLDIVQIPAFLCRQTDLLLAAGQTGKAVLIKKGQFLHPLDMEFCAEKIRSTGNDKVLLCERGSCFGYRELIVDFRGLEWMREIAPVVYDGTHSVQVMGGANGKSSGNRRFIPGLMRAAVALGVDGIFIEAHQDPDYAPSDGPNMLPLDQLEPLLRDLRALHSQRFETRPALI